MSTQRILYFLTRTPLHVGAGASVGAIDQPVTRERHTGFPLIPASGLKGIFANQWPLTSTEPKEKKPVRITIKEVDGKSVLDDTSIAGWLFGSDEAKVSFAGALQFSEARLVAFPIRSAKGGFAWITCPLLLQRAARDGVFPAELLKNLPEPPDDQATFDASATSKLAMNDHLVLEEYTFSAASWIGWPKLAGALAGLLDDTVWSQVQDRVVILGNGMMSYFTRNACEIAQHVRIDDETGTAAQGALFNQENVPSETLFYSVLHVEEERTVGKNPRKNIRAPWTFSARRSAARVSSNSGLTPPPASAIAR